MWLWNLIILVLVILFIKFVVLKFLKDKYGKKGDLWISKDENAFVDPNLSKSRVNFPSLFGIPSVRLSVIIPSYNEEVRLPVMLEETIQYLENKLRNDSSQTYELIIVDDGSKDKTSQVALQYSKQYSTDKIRVLTLQKNRGKGGAVKRGMMVARGKYLLMADADGATKFADIERVEKSIKSIETKNELGMSIGSRAHLQTEAIAKRSALRNFLMHGFHMLVSVLGVRGIKDTQCGFKLFTRRSAQLLFPNLHIERWAFDVELIYVAQCLGIPVSEIAVNWTEIDGSKLTPFAASIQMGKDLLRIRAGYMFGIWTIDSNPSN